MQISFPLYLSITVNIYSNIYFRLELELESKFLTRIARNKHKSLIVKFWEIFYESYFKHWKLEYNFEERGPLTGLVFT